MPFSSKLMQEQRDGTRSHQQLNVKGYIKIRFDIPLSKSTSTYNNASNAYK